jgi:hypothetical protein
MITGAIAVGIILIIGDRAGSLNMIILVIMIGCVFVKLLTTLPIPTVINLV